MGLSAEARTGLGTERCGLDRFGKLPLGKLHIWKVDTWENTLGKTSLGKYLTFYKMYTVQVDMAGYSSCSKEFIWRISCIYHGYIQFYIRQLYSGG